jgi:hypothetical protein
VAGAESTSGWVDAVSTAARVKRPYNGVFVKNPDYVKQGRDDVYDFYFTDCENFCVRYLTPDGVVRTYAGRGKSTNGNIWGTEDGDLRETARFRDVSGIAYDEAEDAFYVLDQYNARIRRIGMETDDNNDNAEDNKEDEQLSEKANNVLNKDLYDKFVARNQEVEDIIGNLQTISSVLPIEVVNKNDEDVNKLKSALEAGQNYVIEKFVDAKYGENALYFRKLDALYTLLMDRINSNLKKAEREAQHNNS